MLAILVAMGVGVLACSAEDSPPLYDVSEFVKDYCAAYTPCCRATEMKTCQTLAAASVVSRIERAQGEDCLTLIRRDTQKDMVECTMNSSRWKERCQPLFPGVVPQPAPGSVQPGRQCHVDADCAQQPGVEVICESGQYSGPSYEPINDRRCRVLRFAQAGEACVGSRRGTRTDLGYNIANDMTVCLAAQGLSCLGSSPPTCSPLVPEGGKCSREFDCALGLVCFAGTCQKTIALGQPCVYPNGPSCDEGTYCTIDRTCARQLADGEPCGEREIDECAIGYCDVTCLPRYGGPFVLTCDEAP